MSSDGGELTRLVVERLLADGWQVAVLAVREELVAAQLPEGVKQYVVSAPDEAVVRRTLTQLQDDLGGLDAAVHLDAASDSAALDPDVWARRKLALRTWLLATSQLQAGLAKREQRAAYLTVSRLDGQFGLSGNAFDPFAAALFGLTKSVAREWPDVFCRALDLSQPMAADDAAKAVLHELYDPDRNLLQAGYDGRVRYALVPAEPPADATQVTLDERDVFLVSGGARGVTAHCVLELARQTRCKLILVGRTPIVEDEPEWARGRPDAELLASANAALRARGDRPSPLQVQQLATALTAQRELARTLSQLRAAGSEVVYIACDVAAREELAQRVRQAQQQLGRITGIIHGAGVLADKLIEKKRAADFDLVFDTKVEGLVALLGCVDIAALRVLALFSSAAGFFGNRGQTDYAMANEALNAWAHHFQAKHPACRVVSLNFGPWDGGMVTPTLRRMFEQAGVSVIDADGGAELVVDALRHTPSTRPPLWLVGSATVIPKPIVQRVGRRFTLRRELTLQDNPLLRDHCIAGRVVLPFVHAGVWLANACEDVYPGYRAYRLEELWMLKGVVLDDHLPSFFDVTLEEQVSERPDELWIMATLSAPQPSGKHAPYYRGRMLLKRSAPDPLPTVSCDLWIDPAWAERKPYEDGTLFHGPAFRAVQRVLNYSERHLTLECTRACIDERAQGQFPLRIFDPYSADACFQSVLIWVRERYGSGCLPVGLARADMYGAPAFDRPYYVTLSVSDSSAGSATFDLYVHDRQGNVFGFLSGAKVTISPRLNQLFQAPAAHNGVASA
ncbi:MAG TPA: SDR family oxidoreductase [Polyangiales bacterium]|nr:SDR family oxidoreductase [Polyangiales bacterium]